MRRTDAEIASTVSKMRQMLYTSQTKNSIMSELHISERTFYRYAHLILQADRDYIREQERALLADELQTLRDRLSECLKEAFLIMLNQRVALQVRLKAIRTVMEVSTALMQVSFDGPLMIQSSSYIPGRLKL